MEIIVETPDKESIDLRVNPNCTIERLKTAIKKKLGLGEDAADFLLFYPWEECLDDLHSKETKLVDLGYPVDILSMRYPTAGKISDKLFPPVPVIIKSDEVRKIVLPHKIGRSPGKYWDDCEINSTERRIQLSSIDFFGKELRLWIEDPTQSKKPGTCRTLGFKLPRSTRKVLVRKDSENPVKFNLYCELQTGPEKVIKDDDWTFADRPGSNANESERDVKFIKFSEGVFRPFLDSDQKREQVWDAYVKPVIPLAEKGAEAAAGLL